MKRRFAVSLCVVFILGLIIIGYGKTTMSESSTNVTETTNITTNINSYDELHAESL